MSDKINGTEGVERMPVPCEQEQNIKEIKGLLGGLTAEFRGLLSEMREVFVEDREHKIRIQNLEKGQEVIFEKLREISRNDKALFEWKNKLDGTFNAVKVIPIVCVIITTIMALYTFSVNMAAQNGNGYSHKNPASTSAYGVPNEKH
jgi:hypothetical protein